MMQKKCLNCNYPIENKYCSNCSQPTDTHRFTLSDVFDKNIIKLPVDKGIINTTKSLLTRPGYAVFEYIKGKRQSLMNFFAFYLVLLGFQVFVLNHIIKGKDQIVYNAPTNFIQSIAQWILENQKVMFFIILIPCAIVSYYVFKKYKYYLGEQIVTIGYLFGGFLLVNIILDIINYFLFGWKSVFPLWMEMILRGFISFSILVYSFIFLFQFYKEEEQYSKWKLYLKIFFFMFISLAIYMLLKVFLAKIAGGYQVIHN